MDVKRRDGEVVMVVLFAGQTLGQIARPMLIDVCQGRDTCVVRAAVGGLFDLALTDYISNSLRPACVALPVANLIECFQEVVINSDGDALHGEPAFTVMCEYL